MKYFLIYVIFVLISVQNLFSQNNALTHANFTKLDSLVHYIIDDIDSNSIRSYIQELQDFGTRYFLAENRKEIAEWIAGKFMGFGFVDVEIDSFLLTDGMYGNSMHYNVIATLPGIVKPSEIYLLGAHYDSRNYDDPLGPSPGADDGSQTTVPRRQFRVPQYPMRRETESAPF